MADADRSRPDPAIRRAIDTNDKAELTATAIASDMQASALCG